MTKYPPGVEKRQKKSGRWHPRSPPSGPQPHWAVAVAKAVVPAAAQGLLVLRGRPQHSWLFIS